LGERVGAATSVPQLFSRSREAGANFGPDAGENQGFEDRMGTGLAIEDDLQHPRARAVDVRPGADTKAIEGRRDGMRCTSGTENEYLGCRSRNQDTRVDLDPARKPSDQRDGGEIGLNVDGDSSNRLSTLLTGPRNGTAEVAATSSAR
jgi:hypothetical protein